MKLSRTTLLLCTFLFFTTAKSQNLDVNISHISAPAIDWTLTIDLNNFEVEENVINPEGNSRSLVATQNSLGLTASVFIEKAEGNGDYIAARKFYWDKAAKSPLSKENLLQYEKGNIAFVEHDTKEFEGKKVDYHSVNGYLSHNGYWIDIHVSKVGYKAEDKNLFEKIFNSVKIETPKVRNVSELFLWSAVTYFAHDYKNAIGAYESILETEKDKINMDKTIWRVVVDNLGMSYGISGDLNNSVRTYEYGIKFDPEYPNFYYSIACAYAEMSDLDKALSQLEIAYAKKDNVIEGEQLPNPSEDPSFEKYKNDKKFKDFLKKNKL
jgi:tetratricopeptide (TPR) repeat protein